MRRLLLVAYYFPPETAAGALRPSYLATYLREFGWDVTVLTRQIDGASSRENATARVVAAPVFGDSIERSVRSALSSTNGDGRARSVSPLRAALRWARKSLSFPDRAIGWAPAAVARACALGRKERFDAVLSTATPATAHVIGAMTAYRLAIPWVADYRDPWAGNPGAQEGRVRTALQRALERSLLRRASAITTISKPIAAHLEDIHGRDVTVIPNASEPLDWAGLDSVRPRRFELCYTGSMHAEHRTPALLFEALASLRAQDDPAGCARVVFFGPSNEHVLEEARRNDVAQLVEHRGIVPRTQALAAQREASDLLIFLNMDPSSAFELGSKIIEYTRARRPIIAFGPAGSVMREHLSRHSLGWFASDLEQAREALRAAHRRFLDGDVELPPSGDGFEARDLAKAFAAQLDAVI
jgi:hypothetical protein